MENYNRKYECNVYYVKVIIELPFNPNKKDVFVREANVLAISEDAAVRKIERQFQWELREKLKDKDSFAISHEVKLLVESVTY